MKARIFKQVLNESVIDSKKILDKAYELLSKDFSSDKIKEKVNKILKKAKSEKDALKKIEGLSKKEKEIKSEEKEMNFKESVKYYLGINKEKKETDYYGITRDVPGRINEMALKHLAGTEEMWKDGDIDGVADKYIENILADGKNYSNILRGLTNTFGSKKFAGREEDAEELKATIRKKVRAAQKAEKEKVPPKARLIKKTEENWSPFS